MYQLLHFTTTNLDKDCCLVVQSCLTLCDPMDCSPAASSAHGIFQTRILEWAALPSTGDLPNPGVKTASPTLAGRSFTTEPPRKPLDRDCYAQLTDEKIISEKVSLQK